MKKCTKCKEDREYSMFYKNKNICGLNVSWNLQILTREDNNRKKNKFDGTNENTSWRIK
tara:strand:+ start:471 stop:647 length:177 start_codon:yes stop_codon:yes gene_type:complete